MYIDTSCLVAYYVPEEFTEKVDDLIRETDTVFISEITKVEFLSALNKKNRMGFFTIQETRIAFRKFEEHIHHGLYSPVSINIEHYQSAVELLLQTKSALRTLDAIHLGIVQQERIAIASNDRILLQSAEEFNIPTIEV